MDWLNSVTEQKIFFWITLKKILVCNHNQPPLEESISFLIKIEEQKKNLFFYQLTKTIVFSKIYHDFVENIIVQLKQNYFSFFFFKDEKLFPKINIESLFTILKVENCQKNFDFRRNRGNDSQNIKILLVDNENKKKSNYSNYQMEEFILNMDEKYWIKLIKKREKYFDFFSELINDFNNKIERIFCILKTPFLNLIILSLCKCLKLIRYNHESEFFFWIMKFLETIMEFSSLIKKKKKTSKILNDGNYLKMKQLQVEGYKILNERMNNLFSPNIEHFFKTNIFKKTKSTVNFKEEFLKILAQFYKDYQEKYFISNRIINQIEKRKKINVALFLVVSNIFVQVDIF